VKLYRKKGPSVFFQEQLRCCVVVLTGDVMTKAQTLLDEELNRSAVAQQVGVKSNTLAKAIRAGRLHERKKTPAIAAADAGQARSQRSKTDAAAPMGMGAR
jgi:hypothetical protein